MTDSEQQEGQYQVITELLGTFIDNAVSEAEYEPEPTEAGQKAAAEALEEIRQRSFVGRNPHLGKMINCKICDLRHRGNHPKCVQRFSTQNREGDPVQGELVPPEGLAQLTAKQVLGAKFFAKRRQRPRRKPQKPMTKWHRVLKQAEEKKQSNAKTV